MEAGLQRIFVLAKENVWDMVSSLPDILVNVIPRESLLWLPV